MKILIAIKDEFLRSPIATSAALSGLIGGWATILAAWAWITNGTFAQISIAEQIDGKVGPPALLIIGVFLLTTPASAAICIFLYRLKRSVSLFASVIIASLTAFTNRFNANLMGYPPTETEQVKSVEDLIFFGTIFIFVAVAGRTPLIDFIRPIIIKKEESEDENQAFVIFGALAIIILIWGGAVAWTYNRLVTAFIG